MILWCLPEDRSRKCQNWVSCSRSWGMTRTLSASSSEMITLIPGNWSTTEGWRLSMFADHHHGNSFGDYPLVIRPGNAQIPQFLDDLAIKSIIYTGFSRRGGFSTIFSQPRSGFETVLAISAVCCWEPQKYCHDGPNGPSRVCHALSPCVCVARAASCWKRWRRGWCGPWNAWNEGICGDNRIFRPKGPEIRYIDQRPKILSYYQFLRWFLRILIVVPGFWPIAGHLKRSTDPNMRCQSILQWTEIGHELRLRRHCHEESLQYAAPALCYDYDFMKQVGVALGGYIWPQVGWAKRLSPQNGCFIWICR